MSWFSSRGSSPRKEQGRVQTILEPDVHRSLALAALFEEIRKRKMTVLDLGSTVWDRFNYLQRKELANFAEQLRRFSRPGTLALALISYHKTIPAQPYRFKIKDEQHLIYDRQTHLDRPSPRFPPAEITGLLKGFRVDRSFLLQHGIQEYLLVRE